MARLKDLRRERKKLRQECESLEYQLRVSIEDAKSKSEPERSADTEHILHLSAQFESIKRQLLEKEELIKKKRRKKGKSRGKPVRKVHYVSGRYIDPTGFAGVVQGGAPGGGKRR